MAFGQRSGRKISMACWVVSSESMRPSRPLRRGARGRVLGWGAMCLRFRSSQLELALEISQRSRPGSAWSYADWYDRAVSLPLQVPCRHEAFRFRRYASSGEGR